MKLVRAIAVLFVGMLTFSAFAQTYPVNNPTYNPNATQAAFTVASNVASTPMILQGIGVVSLQLSGTCTGLQGGYMQGSVDGTNYATLNMYANGVLVAASAVTSVSGVTGIYSVNTAGLAKVRMNNTGLSAAGCVGKMVGSPLPFSLPR